MKWALPLEQLGISIGQIYSSKLNRAIETGSLMSGAQITPVNELTDSGAGGASAMANPNGSNTKIGNAIRALVNKAPAIGTNNLLITHKTNIADAFGKELADVKEGETSDLPAEPLWPSDAGRACAGERVDCASRKPMKKIDADLKQCPLLVQSGHRLVHRTCPLLTQSGHPS